jgi:hypothetical protein
MPKYIVKVPEVHIQEVEIEADTAEEALDLVLGGDGELVGDVQYDSTLDPHEKRWEVIALDE